MLTIQRNSAKDICILFFILLAFIPAANATDIRSAPPNPDFLTYLNEELEPPSGNTAPSPAKDQLDLFTNGLIPAPSTPVWPSYGTDTFLAATGEDSIPLPSYYNLRNEGRLTPVRDQGYCGCCWAFAAFGSLESVLLTDTGIPWDFSENHMKNLRSNRYPQGYDWSPCDGGNAYMATAYLSRRSGPVNETDDPYLLPIPSSESPVTVPPVLHVQNVSWLPPREDSHDNDLLKRTIHDSGAIYTAFLVNITCFGPNTTDYYRGSTYYLPNETYTAEVSHAVTLVGWDDTYPAENFSIRPPGNGAFIIKNSWGTDAGNEGYLYISYYDISFARRLEPALFTAEPAGRLDTIYQYDPLGWTDRIGDGETTTYYGANVFTASGYQNLQAVSFYTSEVGTEYTAALYRDIDIPPTNASGAVALVSGTTALPGYHTIPLAENVSLSPGQTFSVVLKLTAPSDTCPLVVEAPVPGYSGKATAVAGQSYVKTDGEEWEDLTDSFPDTNVCIKALATDAPYIPPGNSTIQTAVDAAQPGATVIVESGTYPETVILNKPVTLRGVDTGDGLPVVDGHGDGSSITIAADGVIVDGFVVTGAGRSDGDAGVFVTAADVRLTNITAEKNARAGIVVSGTASNTTLFRCVACENGEDGIYMRNSAGSTLVNCTAYANGDDGIYLEYCPASHLTTCTTDRNANDGIQFRYCENSTLTTCLSTGNFDEGMDIWRSGDSVLDRCTITSNGDIGMYLLESPECIINAVTSDENNGGIYLKESDTVCIRNCTAGANTVGFVLEDSPHCRLQDCIAERKNTVGIGITNAEGIVLTNITSRDNAYGFQIENPIYASCISASISSLKSQSVPSNPPSSDSILSFTKRPQQSDEEGNYFNLTQWERETGRSDTDTTTTDSVPANASMGQTVTLLETPAVTLAQCDAINNTWDGMYIRGRDVALTTCTASGNGYTGIEAYSVMNGSFTDCIARNNDVYGILLGYSEDCTLTRNFMADNGMNFGVRGINEDDFSHSIDLSNTVDGKKIYYLLNRTGNPTGEFAGAGTIYAINCSGLDIQNQSLSDNLYGILFLNTTDSILTRITATDNRRGISLVYSENNSVSDSVVATNWGEGIMLGESAQIMVSDCILSDNDEGVCLLSSANCTITNCSAIQTGTNPVFEVSYSNSNTLSRCTAAFGMTGIRLRYSNDNQIDGCTAENNAGFGIALWDESCGNRITGCMVENNSDCGMYLNWHCTNNTFWMNDIGDNGAWTYDCPDNLWNSSEPADFRYMGRHCTNFTGNYWGEGYSGADANGDGIGDTPYTCENIIDAFPLMAPTEAYYTFVEDTGDDDTGSAERHDAAAAGSLQPGDVAYLHFAGAAVSDVTITAAAPIPLLTLTVTAVPEGPDGLEGPVYQYLEADLIHITNNAIGEATITFSVPTAWLTAQGLTPADVVLWRFHDGVWVPLPTEVVGEEGDHVVFRAVSPGFSYFAIGEGEAAAEQPAEPASSVGTDEDTETLPADTSAPTQVSENTAEPAVSSETTGEATTTSPTPPQQSPAGLCSILAACGIAGMLLRRD